MSAFRRLSRVIHELYNRKQTLSFVYFGKDVRASMNARAFLRGPYVSFVCLRQPNKLRGIGRVATSFCSLKVMLVKRAYFISVIYISINDLRASQRVRYIRGYRT